MSQNVSCTRRAALIAALALAGASHSGAQVPTMTERDFETSMVEIGEAFDVIEPMTASPAYLLNSVRGDSLARLAIARTHMDCVRAFFETRAKKEGAVFAAETLDAMDVFRRELSRAEPDQAAAVEAVQAVDAACAACHAVYREGTKETGFRFRRGTL